MDYGSLKNQYKLQDLGTDTREQIVSDLSVALTPVVTGNTTITQTFVNGINLATTTPQPNYLKFTAEQDNSTVRFCHLTSASTKWDTSCDIEYSLDAGQTWTDYGVIVDHSGTLITLASGKSVYFRSNTVRKFGGVNNTTTVSGNNVVFKMTGKIRADGSLNSLIDKSATCDCINTVAFCYLFSACTSLTKAPELPATSIGGHSYYYMFRGCTSLIDASILLPTKCVPAYAYEGMFYGCSNLKYGPFINANFFVPTYSFRYMFYNCTKLESVGNMVLSNPTTGNTSNWLYGTTSSTISRTIYLQSGTTWAPANSVHGIPASWEKVYI